MKKYHINESELISYIFEHNKYTIEERFDLSQVADSLKTTAIDTGKKALEVSKNIGRELASAPLARTYASIVRKNLNRDIQSKRENFALIKEMFKESIYCLRFFMKSNYSRYMAFIKNFYSWEIVIALIHLYNVKENETPLAEASQKIDDQSPDDYKDTVIDFYERIKNGSILLDGKNIVEKGRRGRKGKGYGGGSQQNQNSISSNDISTLFNFLINPSSGLMKISQTFNGDYEIEFLNLFENAKNLNQISNKTKQAIEDIVDTIKDTQNDFYQITSGKIPDLEKGMEYGLIKFPNNDITSIITGGIKRITYSPLFVLRGYSIEKDFNFSTCEDSALFSKMNPFLLRLKFMFLFVKVFSKTNSAEYLIEEVIKKISYIKN